MADPDTTPTPPSRGPADRGDDDRPAGSAAAEQPGERVQRQRRHIEGLTGRDPLRGGVDD
jgi:hypothetical protein